VVDGSFILRGYYSFILSSFAGQTSNFAKSQGGNFFF
jgi:hypothetical protein